MKKIKIAVIGVGNMGASHAASVSAIAGTELVAVCDVRKERADETAARYGCRAFYSTTELFDSNCAEAVTVATPHYAHTPITIDAFGHGLHVLTEKPVAVTVSDAKKMNAAHAEHPELRFALAFQMRTIAFNRKIKEMIDTGEFGRIQRVSYTFTTAFRPQCYYDSGDWRATWAGEGGGVLSNQCPHQLDLFQWFFGMPERISAYVAIAKYHNIEVEDEVNAFCEFPGGMTGNFIVSTGEYPGVNRLEICGTRGVLLFDGKTLLFRRNATPSDETIRSATESFPALQCKDEELCCPETPKFPHLHVMENFIDAVRDPDVQLITPGEEGVRPVELANAMLYSGLVRTPVTLPLDSGVYDAKLAELVRNSHFVKSRNSESGVVTDMNGSFAYRQS